MTSSKLVGEFHHEVFPAGLCVRVGEAVEQRLRLRVG